MNQTPWQMWNLETGKPPRAPARAEAMEVLESAFETIAGVVGPSRPAASLRPPDGDVAVPAARAAGGRPAARAGARCRATWCTCRPTSTCCAATTATSCVYNQKAIVADRKFLAREGRDELLRALPHPQLPLRDLRRDVPRPVRGRPSQAAQELIDTTPEALLRIPSPPMADFLEGYLPMKQHVLIRFGKWREIIAQELPEDRELYCSTTAMMLYAKGGGAFGAGRDRRGREGARGLPRGQGARAREPAACTTTPSRTCWTSPTRC